MKIFGKTNPCISVFTTDIDTVSEEVIKNLLKEGCFSESIDIFYYRELPDNFLWVGFSILTIILIEFYNIKVTNLIGLSLILLLFGCLNTEKETLCRAN